MDERSKRVVVKVCLKVLEKMRSLEKVCLLT